MPFSTVYHKEEQKFPKILYAYRLLDGHSELLTTQTLKNIPDQSTIVAVYRLESTGKFSREIKFEIIEDEQ